MRFLDWLMARGTDWAALALALAALLVVLLAIFGLI